MTFTNWSKTCAIKTKGLQDRQVPLFFRGRNQTNRHARVCVIIKWNSPIYRRLIVAETGKYGFGRPIQKHSVVYVHWDPDQWVPLCRTATASHKRLSKQLKCHCLIKSHNACQWSHREMKTALWSLTPMRWFQFQYPIQSKSSHKTKCAKNRTIWHGIGWSVVAHTEDDMCTRDKSFWLFTFADRHISEKQLTFAEVSASAKQRLSNIYIWHQVWLSRKRAIDEVCVNNSQTPLILTFYLFQQRSFSSDASVSKTLSMHI